MTRARGYASHTYLQNMQLRLGIKQALLKQLDERARLHLRTLEVVLQQLALMAKGKGRMREAWASMNGECVLASVSGEH